MVHLECRARGNQAAVTDALGVRRAAQNTVGSKILIPLVNILLHFFSFVIAILYFALEIIIPVIQFE